MVIPPGAVVKRVAEEHRTVGRHPDIVRAIQIFALIIFHQHRALFVRGDGPQLVTLIRAGDEVALGIEHHAVGVAGGLEEGGEFSLRAPLHDAVVRLVHEKHVAGGITGGTFGESKAAGQFLQLGIRGGDRPGGDGGGGQNQDGGGRYFHTVRPLWPEKAGMPIKNRFLFLTLP